jgi:hypothetical protein
MSKGQCPSHIHAWRYATCFQLFRATMHRIVDGSTPNTLAASTAFHNPNGILERKMRTPSAVSFADPCLSPHAVLPCRRLSASFSEGVPHRRFPGRLLILSPSRWRHSYVGVGFAPAKARSTIVCTAFVFRLPSITTDTNGYPVLPVASASRNGCGFLAFTRAVE